MGFCLLNNIAVAAAAARAAGAARVAIVDWDVHHGNGTQDIFWDDPTVLYLSSHQFPYYPGTGAPTEIGGDAARGATVNVGLPAGCGRRRVPGRLRRGVRCRRCARFKPDLLLVSAGFDAYRADPLAGMRVTHAGLRAMATGCARPPTRSAAAAWSPCSRAATTSTASAGGMTEVLRALTADVLPSLRLEGEPPAPSARVISAPARAAIEGDAARPPGPGGASVVSPAVPAEVVALGTPEPVRFGERYWLLRQLAVGGMAEITWPARTPWPASRRTSSSSGSAPSWPATRGSSRCSSTRPASARCSTIPTSSTSTTSTSTRASRTSRWSTSSGRSSTSCAGAASGTAGSCRSSTPSS